MSILKLLYSLKLKTGMIFIPVIINIPDKNIDGKADNYDMKTEINSPRKAFGNKHHESIAL
jgi:hypothetical protein